MSGDNGALTVILLGAGATFIWRLLGIGLSSRLRPDDAGHPMDDPCRLRGFGGSGRAHGHRANRRHGGGATNPARSRPGFRGRGLLHFVRRSALAGVVAGSALVRGLVSLAGLA